MVTRTLDRIGRILLGICAASFTLEQAIYLNATQSCSEVASAKSDVLGGNDDCFVRTRGCGSSCESDSASRYSPTDHDARDLWVSRVGTVASFGSPQLCELERNRRDLRLPEQRGFSLISSASIGFLTIARDDGVSLHRLIQVAHASGVAPVLLRPAAHRPHGRPSRTRPD